MTPPEGPSRETDRPYSSLRRGVCGGGRGIRTPGTLSGPTVFKTAAFDRSAIPPAAGAPECLAVVSFDCSPLTARGRTRGPVTRSDRRAAERAYPP